MTEDALEATACGSCPSGQASWSPLWGVYLCHTCRASRTEAELRMTLAGGKKPAPGPYLCPALGL